MMEHLTTSRSVRNRRKPRLLAGGLLLCIIVLMQESCYYDNEVYLYGAAPCDTTGITYNQKIAPLIADRCFPCHTAANANAGVVVEGYDALKAYVNDSSLMCVVRHESGCSPMPKNAAKLSACEIQLLQLWINQGSPNN